MFAHLFELPVKYCTDNNISVTLKNHKSADSRYKACVKSLKASESEIVSSLSLSLSRFPFVLFFISLPSLRLTSEQNIQLCSPTLQTNLWPCAEPEDHLALSQPHLALSENDLHDAEVARRTLPIRLNSQLGQEQKRKEMKIWVQRNKPNDRRYHLMDTSAQAFTVFTANTGYLQGGRDTKRHTRGYCSSWHQWHTLFGELCSNHRQEKSNYAVNCVFL